MEEKLLTVALFLVVALNLFVPRADAQTIGIGVEPSLLQISLTYNSQQPITFKFWNEGDTETNYTIVPDQSMLGFLSTGDCNYWCGENIVAPANMTKSDAILKTFLFKSNTNADEQVTTGISIYGEPVGVNQSGTLNIRRRVYVTITVNNFAEATTASTTAIAGSEGEGGNYPTASSTTTISTTTAGMGSNPTSRSTSTTSAITTVTTTPTKNNNTYILYGIVIICVILFVVGLLYWSGYLYFPVF